ncbi:MAG: 4Fe-4S dicluster domain-containing protein [Chloroflexota bacterium]
MPATRRAFLTGRPNGESRVRASDACLARLGVHCQSCSDACPELAIRFTPRLGAPPLPVIAAAQCTGCGDCVGVCPVDALVLAPANARA